MSETGDDLEVLITHQFTIELAGSDVRVSDGNGRKGGNARGRGSRFRIRWANRTGKPCRLIFHQWTVDGDGNAEEVPIWPFADPADPDDEQGNRLLIPANGEGSNPGNRMVQLKPVQERTIIKYDVVVNPNAPMAILDPMIVVER